MKTNMYNKWYWPALLVFIFLRLFVSPKFGLVAIICMIAPLVMVLFKGRMWCGRFCPAAAFMTKY